MGKGKDNRGRFYRRWVNSSDLIRQELLVGETDICISAEKDVRHIAEKSIKKYRNEIESYIEKHPRFKVSLEPLGFDHDAPDIIKNMLQTSKSAGVGPMASVAGAIAEFTGGELLSYVEQIILENGGDIFIASNIERRVAVFAGGSQLSSKLSIKVKPEDTPLGICTSSATVGHSLSFGKADACVIISKSTLLADAVATATCNRVRKRKDIKYALKFATSISGVRGALIIYKNDFGASGDIELA